jgi:hypothetical protein
LADSFTVRCGAVEHDSGRGAALKRFIADNVLPLRLSAGPMDMSAGHASATMDARIAPNIEVHYIEVH